MDERNGHGTVQEQAAYLRSHLTSGGTPLGCFLSLGSSLTAEMIGSAGFDFALIDLEHGAGTEQDALHQIQALGAAGCPAVVRVESSARQRVGRVLEFGAHGVMFPRIDSQEEARDAVAAMRYAPQGVRGVASVNRACRYGANFRPYMSKAANLLTVVQIESAAALNSVEAIAATDGVDVLFIGPWDLSHELGILGEFEHPEFLRALAVTAAATQRYGKYAGMLLPTGMTLSRAHTGGYRFIVAGSDAGLLSQAARSLAESLRKERAEMVTPG